MSGNSGYQGFRSWSALPCAVMKPGETLRTRATKFSGVGFGVVYPNGPPVGNTPYKSVGQETSVAHGDYRVPDRMGVMANRTSMNGGGAKSKFIATTTSSVSHVDFRAEAEEAYELTEERLTDAFRVVDEDGTGYVQLTEFRKLVREALGGKAPSQRVVQKFVKLFEENQDGQASLEEVLAGAQHVKLLMRSESTRGAAADPLGAAKSAQVKLLTGGPMASSHELDFGAAGSLPQQRGYTYKAGLSSCTQDLNDGTSKDSFALPGYGGFLARSTNNADAAMHSNQELPRRKAEDLRLYFSHDLPGYTGHKPDDVRNDFGMRTGGCDPRTTSGAAAIGL